MNCIRFPPTLTVLTLAEFFGIFDDFEQVAVLMEPAKLSSFQLHELF
jgi:hypothetical protein